MVIGPMEFMVRAGICLDDKLWQLSGVYSERDPCRVFKVPLVNPHVITTQLSPIT